MIRDDVEGNPPQLAPFERRKQQVRVVRRNQIFGVLLVAAAILLAWLLRTNPRWIFPQGWWRP
jgi:hypothetical protein